MKVLIGTVLVLCGVALGLYVGGYVMFFKGIVMIIEALKTDVINATDIAWGIVKIVGAGFVGTLCALFPISFGAALIKD